MNTAVTRPGHMLPMWKQGERQPYGGHSYHLDAESFFHNACSESEQPTVRKPLGKAYEERWSHRALDFLMGFAFGVGASFFTLWVALLLSAG